MSELYNSRKKVIDYNLFVEKISDLCIQTNYSIDADFLKLIKEEHSKKKTPNKLADLSLKLFIENNKIAKKNKLPVCQDTGISIFYVEIGKNVVLSKSTVAEALQAGASNAFISGYLRKSMVLNPLTRKPVSPDNSPAIIYTDIVAGDKLKIWYMPKGGGSENVSIIKCFNPSDDELTIINFVVEHIKSIGAKACPPYKIGVCIGGSFDYCALQSKKILIDEFADTDAQSKKIALKIKNEVNQLGIGPQGFGGTPTVVKVNMKLLPAHIAMLPVAVSVSCNAARIGKLIF